jgi:hypothetical protein
MFVLQRKARVNFRWRGRWRARGTSANGGYLFGGSGLDVMGSASGGLLEGDLLLLRAQSATHLPSPCSYLYKCVRTVHFQGHNSKGLAVRGRQSVSQPASHVPDPLQLQRPARVSFASSTALLLALAMAFFGTQPTVTMTRHRFHSFSPPNSYTDSSCLRIVPRYAISQTGRGWTFPGFWCRGGF